MAITHPTNTQPGTTSNRRKPRKVAVDFPTELFDRTEDALQHLQYTRSELIRVAVEEYLTRSDQKRLEASLIAGYTENAVQTSAAAEELLGVESDFA